MNRRAFLAKLAALAAVPYVPTKVYSILGSGLWTPPEEKLVTATETMIVDEWIRGGHWQITGVEMEVLGDSFQWEVMRKPLEILKQSEFYDVMIGSPKILQGTR